MMSVGWNRARCGFPCGRSCWLSGTMEVFQPLSPTPVAPHAQEASRRSAQYRTCCSSVPICIDHGPITSSVSILMYVLEHSICSTPSSSSSQGRVSYHSVRSRARRHRRPDTPSRPHIRPYQTAPRPTSTRPLPPRPPQTRQGPRRETVGLRTDVRHRCLRPLRPRRLGHRRGQGTARARAGEPFVRASGAAGSHRLG